MQRSRPFALDRTASATNITTRFQSSNYLATGLAEQGYWCEGSIFVGGEDVIEGERRHIIEVRGRPNVHVSKKYFKQSQVFGKTLCYGNIKLGPFRPGWPHFTEEEGTALKSDLYKASFMYQWAEKYIFRREDPRLPKHFRKKECPAVFGDIVSDWDEYWFLHMKSSQDTPSGRDSYILYPNPKQAEWEKLIGEMHYTDLVAPALGWLVQNFKAEKAAIAKEQTG